MKKNEMDGACGTYGRLWKYIKCFRGGGPDGKILLGKPSCRWEDNIKIDIQEVRWRARTELIWLRIGTGGGPF
jgi:hypothetical protein